MFSIYNLIPEVEDCFTPFASTTRWAFPPTINYQLKYYQQPTPLVSRLALSFHRSVLNDQLNYYQLSTKILSTNRILSTKNNTINYQLTYYQLKKLIQSNFPLFSIYNLIPEVEDCVTPFARTTRWAFPPTINYQLTFYQLKKLITKNTFNPARFEACTEFSPKCPQRPAELLSTIN